MNHAIAGARPKPDPKQALTAIIQAIARYYLLTDTREVLGPSRHANVAMVRHLAMFIIRKELRLSFPEIGRLFNRDHTTVMAGCRKVAGRIDRKPEFGVRVAQFSAEAAAVIRDLQAEGA